MINVSISINIEEILWQAGGLTMPPLLLLLLLSVLLQPTHHSFRPDAGVPPYLPPPNIS
jgi:hypothetical protein